MMKALAPFCRALTPLVRAGSAGRLVESLLFEVSATDAPVLFATAGTLLVTTAAATLLPARLATRTDPLLVMRGD